MEYASHKKHPSPSPERPDSGSESPAPTSSPARPLEHLIAQAKMSVGPVNDPFEREADAVASRVVRALRRSPGTDAAPATSPTVRRVQRSAAIGTSGGLLDSDTERAVRSASSGGAPLPEDSRSKMEQAFGADFGDVRVHVGQQASELNDRIQAKAFTTGRDIFFRDGLPDSNSVSGQTLLAHELTHTLQQGSATVSRAQRAPSVIQRWPRGSTKHFKERAAERGISEDDAESTYAAGQTHIDTDSGAKVYWDRSTGVALIMSDDGKALVTCYVSNHKKAKWTPV